MHTTDNVADRQTHSDRGIGPVLGRLVHYGGTDQYNTIQCNTIQYNTIFLLIKNSLFQDSVTRNWVIFGDNCGNNCLCLCLPLFMFVFMFVFVFVFVCLGLCLCLFLFLFMFVFMFCFCLCLCLGHKTLKKWCWESVSERRLADLIDVTLVSEDVTHSLFILQMSSSRDFI